jgi:hypothetical protein
MKFHLCIDVGAVGAKRRKWTQNVNSSFQKQISYIKDLIFSTANVQLSDKGFKSPDGVIIVTS